MNVKKIRRRCMVLGCKCIDTYAISKSRDIGGNIVLCKSCLADALSAIKKLEAPENVTKNEAKMSAITAERPNNNNTKRGK